MWTLLAFICIFLPNITFASEECGVPAKPSHGQLIPDKSFYSHGEMVRVNCEENYFLYEKETGTQTCDNGVWLGKPPVCLRNLAYGRNIGHFGSPTNGQPKPHGGVFIHDVKNASEYFFFDFHLEKSTQHAYVYFKGNFSATDHDNNGLPFEQMVIAFDTTTHFYHICPKSLSGDYFECISPDERIFTGAKVEIDLKNKNIDVTNNQVQVKLQIENNGFVVASLSGNLASTFFTLLDFGSYIRPVESKDCGTPPLPLHGSLSKMPNASEAKYTCLPGYTLHGKAVQTCDVTKYPDIVWKTRTPACLESPQQVPANPEETSKSFYMILIAVLVPLGCVVVLLVVGGVIWFCKKTQEQNQRLPDRITMVELPPGDQMKTCSLNNTNAKNCTSQRSLPFTPGVSYPVVMNNDCCIQSKYSSSAIYENVEHDYENIDEILTKR